MATLATAADCLRAFYRLVSTTTGDAALVENGEAANDVAYLCLNHGVESAQRFMIANGMSERWRKRSSVITWSGSDAADGGRYTALPSDFLRLATGDRVSSLTQANGERWGQEITADQDTATGNAYYLKNDQVWLAKGAAPVAGLYLEYQYKHPEFTSAVTLDFPPAARPLLVAFAGWHAIAEGWYPAANDERISRNLTFWKQQARMVARRSRQPRKMTAPRVIGTRYFS